MTDYSSSYNCNNSIGTTFLSIACDAFYVSECTVDAPHLQTFMASCQDKLLAIRLENKFNQVTSVFCDLTCDFAVSRNCDLMCDRTRGAGRAAHELKFCSPQSDLVFK